MDGRLFRVPAGRAAPTLITQTDGCDRTDRQSDRKVALIRETDAPRVTDQKINFILPAEFHQDEGSTVQTHFAHPVGCNKQMHTNENLNVKKIVL